MQLTSTARPSWSPAAPRPVAPHAAVRNERHAAGRRLAALDERLDLRHAEVRVQPRRAAAAWADADLDAVHAALEQEPRAFGGRDIAGDELDAVEPLPECLDRARHHDRVAVRDVDDDDVDAGADELRRAFEVVALGADRGADAKASLFVPRGERQLPLAERDPSR